MYVCPPSTAYLCRLLESFLHRCVSDATTCFICVWDSKIDSEVTCGGRYALVINKNTFPTIRCVVIKAVMYVVFRVPQECRTRPCYSSSAAVSPSVCTIFKLYILRYVIALCIALKVPTSMDEYTTSFPNAHYLYLYLMSQWKFVRCYFFYRTYLKTRTSNWTTCSLLL